MKNAGILHAIEIQYDVFVAWLRSLWIESFSSDSDEMTVFFQPKPSLTNNKSLR